MEEKVYIAIDLKSFYASVECIDRGLDPLTTNLVVADPARTEKTICLAVSPSLKAYGISGRARLFEVIRQVQAVNDRRLTQAPGRRFTGSSVHDPKVREDPGLRLDYITAPPRMSHYMKQSSRIYGIYLQYIAPEDLHVYSVDEVFIDATPYLALYGMTPRELASFLIGEVHRVTGITATAGIGPNLYLCKVAMDLEAKHAPPDKNGVRIAELDPVSYRSRLWDHTPITDFWRVGRGTARRLEEMGVRTMGDIARFSLASERPFFRKFGVNAELLIDHAWGYEPCTMEDIKAYRPENRSISSGQVLQCPCAPERAELILREMADSLSLQLLEKGLVTDQIVLTVGYDRENLSDPLRRELYGGPVTADPYGRPIPKPAHGSRRLEDFTCSGERLMQETASLFREIIHPDLLVRRLTLAVGHVTAERDLPPKGEQEQLDLFTDYRAKQDEEERRRRQEERERRRQQAMLDIKNRFGKNAIVRGMDLQEGATAMERNNQVGGHKA